MKIAVIGTRGFPHVQGGVEKHCENLYPLLAEKGCDVTVFARKAYVSKNGDSPPKSGQSPFLGYEYHGVKIVPIWCPKSRAFEAIVHSVLALVAAWKLRRSQKRDRHMVQRDRLPAPFLLHIHAIGPALVVPLARLLGFKVVFTTHGPDYERAKWGSLAKLALRTGEWCGAHFANRVIAISQPIADDIKRKYGRDATVIPNGVKIPEVCGTDDELKRLGIEKGEYILTVSRFVPEKGLHDLVTAFGRMEKSEVKLIIVGTADHETDYSRKLRLAAAKNQNILMAGLQTGQALEALYSHAGLFVLPSYYEGLPIVLLEAMSYGLSCIASDIPANRNAKLSDERYFRAGDPDALSERIRRFAGRGLTADERKAQTEFVSKNFNWSVIAERTLEVYREALGSSDFIQRKMKIS